MNPTPRRTVQAIERLARSRVFDLRITTIERDGTRKLWDIPTTDMDEAIDRVIYA